MKTKSIIHDGKRCYLCGEHHKHGPDRLEEHHCIQGNPGRKLAEKYGLKVYLCGDKCHRNGKDAAHRSGTTMQMLKEDAQRAFEAQVGTREEWMRVFGRNYL